MKTKIIEFEGINSGDYECFCWEVDIGTFKRIKGKEPDVYDYAEIDDSDFNNIKPIGDKVRLYPSDIFKGNKVKLKIEIEDLDECKQCSDCGKYLKLSELKPHNKYEQYNDVFCDDCLDICSVCGELFADYTGSCKCDSCAD